MHETFEWKRNDIRFGNHLLGVLMVGNNRTNVNDTDSRRELLKSIDRKAKNVVNLFYANQLIIIITIIIILYIYN